MPTGSEVRLHVSMAGAVDIKLYCAVFENNLGLHLDIVC